MKKQESYVLQYKDNNGKVWTTVEMDRANFTAMFILAKLKKVVIIAYFKIKYKCKRK